MNGGPRQKLDALTEPHDFIPIQIKTKESIYQKCAPFYEKGMSLREIARITGIPKTTIRETLRRKERVLNKIPTDGGPIFKKPKARCSGATPYGYGWLDGQLMKDPKEYSIVLQIEKMWHERLSSRAIARRLNELGMFSRKGKLWSHGVVSSIIKRNPQTP